MPNKKVVDIFSPQKKEEKPIIEFAPDKEPPLVRLKSLKPGIKFSNKKKALAGGCFLFLTLLFCYFALAKADIEISPQTQILTLETKLTVDQSINEADFSSKVIPGELFQKEKAVAENFPASGSATKEGKAEGTIRVYNEYSTASQVLVATTRFISAEGKLFRTPKRVTIPGGTYEKGKLVAGYADIKIVADESGPEYNIGPSTFSIPGFAGTDRYTKFYAKSSEPMAGGFLQGASLVTKQDLEQAEESLTSKAKEQTGNSLREELRSGDYSGKYIFIEKAIDTAITETFSLAKEGTEANDFNYQAKAKSKTIIFKKENLNSFVKDFLLSKTPQGYKVHDESLKIEYLPETINLSAGKITLSLNISATVYFDVNLSNLKEAVSGKSLTGSKLFLENQPGVGRVQVDFWPFWVKKAPENLDKISIRLQID